MAFTLDISLDHWGLTHEMRASEQMVSRILFCADGLCRAVANVQHHHPSLFLDMPVTTTPV